MNDLKMRAEITMWGALACAQPWFAAGQMKPGYFFAGIALLAWLIAKFMVRR